MAVICGREEWTLSILFTLTSHLSHSFSPFFLFFPLGSTADGNGRDDRGNKEETQKKKYGDGEIWKGNREE